MTARGGSFAAPPNGDADPGTQQSERDNPGRDDDAHERVSGQVHVGRGCPDARVIGFHHWPQPLTGIPFERC